MAKPGPKPPLFRGKDYPSTLTVKIPQSLHLALRRLSGRQTLGVFVTRLLREAVERLERWPATKGDGDDAALP
jgi:hypothetical protein